MATPKFTIVAMVTLCFLKCQVQSASIVEPNKEQSPESNKNAKQFLEPSFEGNDKTPIITETESNLVLSDDTNMGALFSEALESNEQVIPQPNQWISIDKQSPGMNPQVMVERVVVIKPVPLLLAIILKNNDDDDDADDSASPPPPPLVADEAGPDVKPNSRQEVPEEASSSQNDDNNQPEKTLEDAEKKPVSQVDYADDDTEKKTDSESEPEQDENNQDESNNSDEAEAFADETSKPQDKSLA